MSCNAFILQKFICQPLVIMAVAVIHVVANNQCRSVNTQEQQTGHRCVTASESYTAILNVPSHLCTHLCIQHGECSVINYNHEIHYCLLTSEHCRQIVEDSNYTVTDFSYLQWVAGGANVMDDYEYSILHINAAFLEQTGVWIKYSGGKLLEVKQLYNFWENATRNQDFSTTNRDVLQMMPWCSADWVPFVTGDPIPDCAVVSD